MSCCYVTEPETVDGLLFIQARAFQTGKRGNVVQMRDSLPHLWKLKVGRLGKGVLGIDTRPRLQTGH